MTSTGLSAAELSACWRRDLLENIVPFWHEHSLDAAHGGYFTALDRDGAVLDETKFMWLQGRAVFMWARLHNDVGAESSPELATRWFEAAACGARFNLKHGKDRNGLLLFAVSRDGARPLHMQRKPYAAVFYVLGCLEFAAAVRNRLKAGLDVAGEDPAVFEREAVEYFEKLVLWIDDRTLLGSVHAGAEASSLADVMCLSSLSEEFLHKMPQQRDTWLAHIRESQVWGGGTASGGR